MLMVGLNVCKLVCKVSVLEVVSFCCYKIIKSATLNDWSSKDDFLKSKVLFLIFFLFGTLILTYW